MTIPWRTMMGIAFSRLALSPNAFWSMTLQEFSAAVEAVQSVAEVRKPDRETLQKMLQQFPDQERT